MPGTNTYKDTEAADYLDSIRKHQAENRNANSSAAQFSPTYVLQRSNQINISNSFTNTAKTLGDYDVVNNKSYLVAYLPFQLDSNDASNSNHGIWTGSETYTTGPEINATKFRKAASFNGSSYVTLANESNFDFTISTPFSISYWVKYSSTGTQLAGVSKVQSIGSTNGWAVWNFFTGSDDLIFFSMWGTGGAQMGSGSEIITSVEINDGNWHHIVATYAGNSNRSGMKIYIDGVLNVTGGSSDFTGGTITNNEAVTIGAESDGGIPFTGQIVEVQLWNVELDATDALDLANGKQINKDTVATNPAIIGFSDVT